MEKEIIEKMSRYLELSGKFSKSEKDIFTTEELSAAKTLNNTIMSGTSAINGYASSFTIGQEFNGVMVSGKLFLGDKEIFIDNDGTVKSKNVDKPLTRGEQLEATNMIKIKTRALLLDEYDEYLKLGTILKNYFSTLKTVIN